MLTVSDNRFLLVVNASNAKNDYQWLLDNRENDTDVVDISVHASLFALQGPKSINILEKALDNLTEKPIRNMPRFDFTTHMIHDIPILISRSGYTGSDGFEIMILEDHLSARYLWDIILEAGSDFGIKPCGLAARDALRIEACYSLYGHELSDKITPIEAGLIWAVAKEGLKPVDFIGQERIYDQIKNRPNQKNIAFIVENTKRVARQGQQLLLDGKDIGTVSSGTYSYTLEKSIGMGFVDAAYANPGQKITVRIGKDLHEASLVKKPFVAYQPSWSC